MLIEVTQADIDGGTHGACESCPIQRAISRAIPGRTVYVFGRTCEIGGRVIPLPTNVRAWITSFDYCEAVQPFSFDLDYNGGNP